MKRVIAIILSSLILTTSAYGYTNDDYVALAHIIMGEAEGCDWETKLAIGSVVLNRVVNEEFPDNIEGVIWQEGQYAPTWDGRYWLEPTDECWEAAEYLLTFGSQIDSGILFQWEVE